VSTHAISMVDGGCEVGTVKGPFRQTHVDSDAILLVPVPDPTAGVLIVGHDSITYHDSKNSVTISPEILVSHCINCVSPIDKNRYLCGDTSGTVFLLVLDYDEARPEENRIKLLLKYLGNSTIPHCMSYIDNYVVFVGKKLFCFG
jgi:DNA damage-binding protein 1